MRQKDIDRLISNRVEPSLQENIGSFVTLFLGNFFHPHNLVIFPIDFRRAAERKEQLGNLPHFHETTWEDNTPRKAISADGFGLVASIPRIMGLKGKVSVFVHSKFRH